MADVLAKLSEAKVAAWYRRLAESIAKKTIGGQEPLASILLRHWLDNRDPKRAYPLKPPNYLKQSSYVTDVLLYHREVFLTEEKARLTGGREIWAGVIPRLQKKPGFSAWDISKPLIMTYESLVEVGSGLADLIRIQRGGTAQERDLLTSLRGFQLVSKVTVKGVKASANMVRVTFEQWNCHVKDRYDFNYNEYFTVPNPDFGSNRPDAVEPKSKSIRVYHRNAQRLEKAGLAAPYPIESEKWLVTDKTITASAEVDISRRL